MASNHHVHLKTDNGTQITYQFKTVYWVSFLLIMTWFDPMDFLPFFEADVMAAVPGLKLMDSIGYYDDHTGYVIYLLSPGYNPEELSKQLEIIFKNKFK